MTWALQLSLYWYLMNQREEVSSRIFSGNEARAVAIMDDGPLSDHKRQAEARPGGNSYDESFRTSLRQDEKDNCARASTHYSETKLSTQLRLRMRDSLQAKHGVATTKKVTS
jgi:hypothetical protein